MSTREWAAESEYQLLQLRLRNLARVLGMTPGERMDVVGCSLKGWWLRGSAEGDCKLPMSSMDPTMSEAIKSAEMWLATELESLDEE